MQTPGHLFRNFKGTVSIVVLLLLLAACHKRPPFWDEIQAFKEKDKQHAPPGNAILFIGSSTFHYWANVQAAFPGYTIINRGFGGSTLPDVIRYANDIIFPYHPRQIVIYCGENDLAYDDLVKARIVYERFRKLFRMIRQKLPESSVVFISIKPSPSRENIMKSVEQANELIRNYLKTQPHASYVDIYSQMLHDGMPDKELFQDDMLHMNERGYAIWQRSIQPFLVRN